MTNLEDYVSLIVDATVRSGISRQVEAFKSGFNQVCAIAHFINNKKKMAGENWGLHNQQNASLEATIFTKGILCCCLLYGLKGHMMRCGSQFVN